MTKVDFIAVGLLLATSLQALADDGYFSELDERYVARCKWGRSIVGMAQENMMAGISRRDFLVSVDKVEQPYRWMPRMAQAITSNVYQSRSELPVTVLQERYMSGCLQYYLAK